ncbi:MAG: hypothetical protein H6744_14295 [Deltaproteobacteria bacterium]|nr:hypothetical protein [Deltaproteobacteria bacterium]
MSRRHSVASLLAAALVAMPACAESASPVDADVGGGDGVVDGQKNSALLSPFRPGTRLIYGSGGTVSSEFVVFRREGERAVTSAGVWRHVNEGWGPESPLAYSSALGFAPERGAVIGRVTPSLLEVPDTVREGMTWTSGPHRFEVVRRTFEVTAAGTLPVWEIERGERADTPGAYAFRPGSSFWAEGVGPLTAPDAVDSRDLIGAFVPLEDAPDQQPDAPTLAMEPMAITGTDAKSWVGAEPEVGWAWSRGGQTVLYLRIRGWAGGFGQTVLRRSWSCWRFTAGDTRTAAVEEPKMESADLDSPSTTDINCYGIFRGPNEGTLEMPWKPAWNTRGVWIDADAIRMPSPAPNHAQAGVSVTKTVHPEFTFVGGGPGAIPAGLTHGELMYRLQGGGDYANHMPQLPALGHFRGLGGLTSARHLQTPRHPLALEFAGGLVAEAWLDADGTVGELAPVAQLGGAQTWLAREGANDLLMVDAQGRVDELVVDGDGVRVERLGVLDLPEGVEARLAFRIDEQVLGVVTFEVTEEDPVGSEPDTRKTGFWRVALGAPESPRPQVKPAPRAHGERHQRGLGPAGLLATDGAEDGHRAGWLGTRRGAGAGGDSARRLLRAHRPRRHPGARPVPHGRQHGGGARAGGRPDAHHGPPGAG